MEAIVWRFALELLLAGVVINDTAVGVAAISLEVKNSVNFIPATAGILCYVNPKSFTIVQP